MQKSACLQGCQWSEQNPFLFAAISPAHLSLSSSCRRPGSTTELITRRRQAFLRLLPGASDPFKSWEYWPLQTKFFSLLVVVVTRYGMWDLSSPTRDWTCAPCLNHLTTGEVLYTKFLNSHPAWGHTHLGYAPIWSQPPRSQRGGLPGSS